MPTRYEPRTAATFLLAGLGLGAVLAMIFAPRHSNIPMPVDRPTGVEQREWPMPRAV